MRKKRGSEKRAPKPPPGSTWRATAYTDGGTRDRVELSSAQHPGSVFDELCVDDWLHVEQMDRNVWWLRVGGVVLNVTIGRDGKAAVTVELDP